jgi:NitT/TauT family transport system permease protein
MATTPVPDVDRPQAAPVNRAPISAARRQRLLTWVLPILTLSAVIGFWEFWVWYRSIPHFLIPAPSRIWATLMVDGPSLMRSAWFKVKLTFLSLGLAIVGGVILGGLFPVAAGRNEPVSSGGHPAGHADRHHRAADPDLCAQHLRRASDLCLARGLLSDPVQPVVGLRSADHNLRDLFTLYRATPWQRLRLLLAPSALPYFMAALKIAGGLALIGAVVAEFVAGATGANTGLASRIIESSFRNETPRMFAALVLVSLLGIAIFLMTALASKLVLGHWHESEIRLEA